MIQKLTIQNFLSFKDAVTFSFDASNDKFAEDYQVVKINESTRLLRFAVVYGYNASGKSNLLKVFDFLNYFWFHKSDDPDEGTGVVPFKLDKNTPKEKTVFDLIFFVKGVKYRYQLELDKNLVYLEKLSYYDTNQPTMLFERKLVNNISVTKFNNDRIKIKEAIRERIDANCLKNMSFFAARQRVNATIRFIDDAMMYFKKKVFNIIKPETKLVDFANERNSENDKVSMHLLDFLREADFNITNIKTNVEKVSIPSKVLDMIVKDNDLPEKLRKEVLSDPFSDEYKTILSHSVENERGKETYQFSIDEGEESRGTIRTFGLETALYDAVNDNAVLAIDEIETSLHSKLLEKMLYEFLKADSQSQLIVTTHNDGLLDLINNLIRKDSVWFTEKQKSGVTDLYKLTDFRGLNRIASIREAYRLKRFGATMN